MPLKHKNRYAKKSAIYINLGLRRELSWRYKFVDHWTKDGL